jgi:hypothetical protein
VRVRRAANAATALDHASQVAELTSQALFERLVATPDRQELFVAAIEAAGRATLDAKIMVLGRSMASGALSDDEGIDHELPRGTAMTGPNLRKQGVPPAESCTPLT